MARRKKSVLAKYADWLWRNSVVTSCSSDTMERMTFFFSRSSCLDEDSWERLRKFSACRWSWWSLRVKSSDNRSIMRSSSCDFSLSSNSRVGLVRCRSWKTFSSLTLQEKETQLAVIQSHLVPPQEVICDSPGQIQRTTTHESFHTARNHPNPIFSEKCLLFCRRSSICSRNSGSAFTLEEKKRNYQSINQSFDQSINQSIIRPIDQSTNQPIDQPINQSFDQSTKIYQGGRPLYEIFNFLLMDH